MMQSVNDVNLAKFLDFDVRPSDVKQLFATSDSVWFKPKMLI